MLRQSGNSICVPHHLSLWIVHVLVHFLFRTDPDQPFAFRLTHFSDYESWVPELPEIHVPELPESYVPELPEGATVASERPLILFAEKSFWGASCLRCIFPSAWIQASHLSSASPVSHHGLNAVSSAECILWSTHRGS